MTVSHVSFKFSFMDVTSWCFVYISIVGTLLCLFCSPGMLSKAFTSNNGRVGACWVSIHSFVVIVFLRMMMVMSLLVMRSDLTKSDMSLSLFWHEVRFIIILLSPDLSKIMSLLIMHLFLLTCYLIFVFLIILQSLPSESSADSNFGIFVIFGVFIQNTWLLWNWRKILLISFWFWLESFLDFVKLRIWFLIGIQADFATHGNLMSIGINVLFSGHGLC